jgi:hypothetical protein
VRIQTQAPKAIHPPDLYTKLVIFSAKSYKILLITTNEDEVGIHYLFIGLQVFNIILHPRRTLQGTFITIQFFGENETTAGPANLHGNTPVTTRIVSTENIYIAIYALYLHLTEVLYNDLLITLLGTQVEAFSISSKIAPLIGCF